MGSRYSPLVSFMLVFVLFLFICYNWTNQFVYIKKTEINFALCRFFREVWVETCARMKSKLLYGYMVCYLCLFTHSFSSPRRKYMKELLFVTNRLIPLLKRVHLFRISNTLLFKHVKTK